MPTGRYVLIAHDGYGRTSGRWLGSLPRVLGLMARAPIDRHLPRSGFSPPSKRETMALLRDLIEAGRVTPAVGETFPSQRRRRQSGTWHRGSRWARSCSRCDRPGHRAALPEGQGEGARHHLGAQVVGHRPAAEGVQPPPGRATPPPGGGEAGRGPGLGTPPDVILLTVDSHTPAFARLGALHALDEFARADKGAQFEKYYPTFIQNVQVGGKQSQNSVRPQHPPALRQPRPATLRGLP